MGSLSGSFQPSRLYNILTMTLSISLSLPLLLTVSTVLVSCGKVSVQFQGNTFNVTSGCPSRNPEVQRWHKLCMGLHGDSMVCMPKGWGKKRKFVPRYSNICDALCHVPYSKSMKVCPVETEHKFESFGFPKYSKPEKPSKVILSYLQTGYLVTTGCSISDVRVKRFYGMCMKEFSSETVCRSDRIPGLTLTFPEYTDVCSAMCHNKSLRNLNFCPVNGEVFDRQTNEFTK